MTKWLLALTMCLLASPASAGNSLPEDESKAVIIAYHRIAEENLPYQNLTLAQFDSHIEDMASGNYNILPLPKIIEAITTASPLPQRTIAITLEGAYNSAIENAAPLLLKNEIPFTIFYPANALDRKDPDYASWRALKTLAKNPLVTLANLPASHSHLAHETRENMLRNLNKARQRHREEFNQEVDFLAYPFGEYSLALKDLAKSQGYKAALGLNSGAAHSGSGIYALPRFSMTEAYGDLERFRMVTRALPLPFKDLEPLDPHLKDQSFFTGFTLPEALQNELESLACFISGQGKAQIEPLGSRIEIRSEINMEETPRVRLNCTLPGPASENDETRWRWLGLLYHSNPRNPQPDALQ
ncbi:MAG: polysaccharide deacetylase family protein [Pseudomonadota bacterium]